MKNYLNSTIGRLRILGYLEGCSLLLLMFVAVPVKYMLREPILVKFIGQAHGIFFVLFVFNTLKVAVEQKWNFKRTTSKVIIACFFPFGTFYIDKKILKEIHQSTL
ncbi:MULTISPECIES: DUF3817 domain-containing protein [Aquimarina]|uniref:DUF3817 domain-containing protein n=1 Tax=Aquimarina algiphila TaxID=2047982 RepID=A0A554VDN8_9FLAO|nr:MULTISPECIES: DUF3817 domain-containing protein [Aquimarina]TSE05045.1 DUF3817 domain-containing protein [Aquimarina algiphila]